MINAEESHIARELVIFLSSNRPCIAYHAGANHRRFDILVTHLRIYGTDVVSRFQEVGSEGMPPMSLAT